MLMCTIQSRRSEGLLTSLERIDALMTTGRCKSASILMEILLPEDDPLRNDKQQTAMLANMGRWNLLQKTKFRKRSTTVRGNDVRNSTGPARSTDVDAPFSLKRMSEKW